MGFSCTFLTTSNSFYKHAVHLLRKSHQIENLENGLIKGRIRNVLKMKCFILTFILKTYEVKTFPDIFLLYVAQILAQLTTEKPKGYLKTIETSSKKRVCQV